MFQQAEEIADKIGVDSAYLKRLLYALVAEKLLDRPVEEGRLFYCTRRGDYHELKVSLDKESRQSITEVIRAIDKDVHVESAGQDIARTLGELGFPKR